MKLLIENPGDIRLNKFLLFHCDHMPEIDSQHYNTTLHGYLYESEYYYNKITHETDDRLASHSDLIKTVPREIIHAANDRIVTGKTDWYQGHVRFNVWTNPSILTKRMREYLEARYMPKG